MNNFKHALYKLSTWERFKGAFIILTIMTLSSCNQKHVSTWSDQEIETWFHQSEWVKLSIKPDVSIDKRQFVEQNVLNPKAWEAALKFLKESDFNAMELGRYELSDDGTYASIDEYTTKDSSHFEAHKKYIDIQLLAKGKEYIYVTTYDKSKQTSISDFDSEKDIEFFDVESYVEKLLTTENFMVFFPSDAHQPCMSVDSNEEVRKVVVKVPRVE